MDDREEAFDAIVKKIAKAPPQPDDEPAEEGRRVTVRRARLPNRSYRGCRGDRAGSLALLSPAKRYRSGFRLTGRAS
jgi:hypothetical protein